VLTIEQMVSLIGKPVWFFDCDYTRVVAVEEIVPQQITMEKECAR